MAKLVALSEQIVLTSDVNLQNIYFHSSKEEKIFFLESISHTGQDSIVLFCMN